MIFNLVSKHQSNLRMLYSSLKYVFLTGCICLLFSCSQEEKSAKADVKTEDTIIQKPAGFEEIYYESTSPNAMRATPLYEYLKITFQDDSVWGHGAGDFMQGSAPWKIFFRGKLTDENSMQLYVTYYIDGKVANGTTEVWTMDKKKGRLYRKERAASKGGMGSEEYHRIEAADIPKDFFGQIQGN
ncbi:hypothetical protein BH11BAC7_BH11BAC7_02150 [soil metagenome]